MAFKISHIAIGWGKALGWIPTSTAEQKLSDLRLDLCRECMWAEAKKALKFFNGEAKYEHQLACGKCKCPCLEKTLVIDETCPVNRW